MADPGASALLAGPVSLFRCPESLLPESSQRSLGTAAQRCSVLVRMYTPIFEQRSSKSLGRGLLLVAAEPLYIMKVLNGEQEMKGSKLCLGRLRIMDEGNIFATLRGLHRHQFVPASTPPTTCHPYTSYGYYYALWLCMRPRRGSNIAISSIHAFTRPRLEDYSDRG